MRTIIRGDKLTLPFPKMSWSARNLYELYQRTFNKAYQPSFRKTTLTLFQQQWTSKRLLRAYHGDFIPEQKFKKFYLPAQVSGKAAGGMFAQLEGRLDVAVFRACLARSVYEARAMVLAGKVKLNGKKHKEAHYQLVPGDLVEVDPRAISFLYPAGTPNPHSNGQLSDAAAVEAEAAELADAVTPETAEKKEEPAAAVESEGAAPKPHELYLPPFASPSLFLPTYLEVSFPTCSFVFLRYPDTQKGGEVPSPYDEDGEYARGAQSWYTKLAMVGRGRPGEQKEGQGRKGRRIRIGA